MKYCQSCGTEMEDSAVFCPKCGAGEKAPVAYATVPDEPSTGLNVLSFFFPVVGLILYLVWKDATPLKANGVGKWALIGVIVGVVGSILYSCAIAASMSMYY